jgi:hypothetical protein
MERKFRIIKNISYSHDELNERVAFYVQEWRKNWYGKEKWLYWEKSNYDMMEKRVFTSIEQAEEMIEKFVTMNPHKEVVKEVTH